MAKNKQDKADLVSLRDNMSQQELFVALRVNALKSHQLSVGRGDMLVALLERTVRRIESTHIRIQTLSTIFFAFGLLVIAFAAYLAVNGDVGGEVWGSMFGVGGITSAASIFYTGPLNRIARSVKNLVQLQTAFLGYIRVIGEIDSAFQWRYIERMEGKTLDDISLIEQSATDRMQVIMDTTMKLIDQYASEDSSSEMEKLSKNLEQAKQDLDTRLKKLENPNSH